MVILLLLLLLVLLAVAALLWGADSRELVNCIERGHHEEGGIQCWR
jgi:hypothetical protein